MHTSFIYNFIQKNINFKCKNCGVALNESNTCEITRSIQNNIFPSLLCKKCSPYNGKLLDSNICNLCGDPLTFIDFGNKTCQICKRFPLASETTRSLFIYTSNFKNLIKLFKYCKKYKLADLFSRMIVNYIKNSKELSSINWDLIINLPSTYTNIVNREYNHTGLLANKVAKLLNSKYKYNALISITQRGMQAELKFAMRKSNMIKAFKCNPRLISNKHILLIDDVLTTGSSLEEASKTLLEHNPRSITAITLARSSNFRNYRITEPDALEFINGYNRV